MTIYPYIVGTGAAGTAMQKALFSAAMLHPEWQFGVTTYIGRENSAAFSPGHDGRPILFIANPHGLHCKKIEEGVAAGFAAILCEKPVCVNLDEVERLRQLKNTPPIAVCHGYRTMWGPRTLRDLIQTGELGKIISVEGRYWQSSAAQRYGQPPSDNWKNDPSLSGKFDVLLDLGTHWVDLLFFLAGEKCENISVWKSYFNAEAPHRDTQAHISMDFSRLGRTFGSISKTVHVAGNQLEIHVIGEKARAVWSFEKMDIVTVGIGDESHEIARKKNTTIGSRQAPFHGLGWLEGYVDVIEKLLLKIDGKDHVQYPTLAEALDVTETLLRAV